MSSQKSALDKISKFWSKSMPMEERKLTSWMEHSRVKRAINQRTTGDEFLDWFTYIERKYFQKPIKSALSVGCGEGALERYALKQGMAEVFDAIDIAEGAIANAKIAAQNANILHQVNYTVSDLNQLVLNSNYYDAVFASASLHHIQNLECAFEQISKSLRPEGYFIFNEYIGPTYFQLPEEQLKLINDMLKILPENFRHIIQEGVVTSEIKMAHKNPPLSWFEENDPSEAVRSADILPVLESLFKIVEFKPYGGTLLQFMLQNIVGNFIDGKKEDDAWLDMLIYLENLLQEKGVIRSDFALVVAIPKY